MSEHDKADIYGITRLYTIVVQPEEVYTTGKAAEKNLSHKIKCIPINAYLYTQIMQGVEVAKTAGYFHGYFAGNFPFPLANTEFVEFMPAPVENYWHTRFQASKFVYALDCSYSNFRLIWMAYPSENCGCFGTEAPENLFFDNISRDWAKCGVGVRVIASYFTVDKSTGHIIFAQEKPFLMVLHDIYYHPLCLFELLNELNKKFNVIVPYMHDVVAVSARYVQDKMLLAMCDKIGDILDLLVDNYVDDFKQKFSILAHGAACYLAVSVSSQFKCGKLTLLSPLGKIVPAEPYRYLELYPEPVKMFYNKEPEHSISANSDAGVFTGVLYMQPDTVKEDEIPYVQQEYQRKSSIRLSIARRVSCAAGALADMGPSIQALAAYAALEVSSDSRHESVPVAETPPIAPDDRRKSFALQYRRFSITTAVLVGKAYTQRKPSNRLTEVSVSSEGDLAEVYELINEQMLSIYQQPAVLASLLDAIGATDAAELRTSLNAKELGARSFKRAKEMYLKVLPSICAFCNLSLLRRYRNALYYFDKQFFAMIRPFAALLAETVHLGQEHTTILLGSHDCFLTRETLQYIVDIDERYDKIQCRTVLGAGHDLFDIGLELIKGIV